ncbi:tyrosinase family protein [Rhizobium halophytocola]|uniref:Tyrosinase n=1 Tax=Rhizobium halophytocola TaxID=735519 RepID=A0ABS4DZD4_9HYPH|nr:tyrosinase family protein [Rhizobium halophytocola]MBP1851056.1 tyrosinase [Rhizobium halophytocola]
MVFVRKSVWANGGDVDDPLLFWYAKGVGEMKARPLSSLAGWRFMGAVHGIDTGLWQQYGYFTPGEPVPVPADQTLYWNQCQHQSWYFLPWHRGYVWAIESMLRQAIVDAGGPDDWALPYWNYSDTSRPNARLLPPAFSRQTLPDGSANPLFVQQRYGQGTSPIVLPAGDVTLEALSVTFYTGTSRASSGFGGLKTGFSHGGGVSGRLESKPHNIVHVDIGGQNSAGPGLMSDPDTAGLDPIFWLHHANIDRLWAVWNAAGNSDPTDAAWLNGPMDRKFVMPDLAGNPWFYTPAEMVDTLVAPLGYTYDQFVQQKALASLQASGGTGGAESRTMTGPVEMMGANNGPVVLKGAVAAVTMVQMEGGPSPKLAQMREGTAPEAPRDHRMLLNLENIRSSRDGIVVDVYFNLPAGEKGAERVDLHAGSFGLFGARKASNPEGEQAGNGVTEILDVTDVMSSLENKGEMQGGEVEVHLVPRHPVPDEAPITVERISLYRQPS